MGIYAKQLLISSFAYWVFAAESPQNIAGFYLEIMGTALWGLRSLCVKGKFPGVCPSQSAGPGTAADSLGERAGSKPWLDGGKICGHVD